MATPPLSLIQVGTEPTDEDESGRFGGLDLEGDGVGGGSSLGRWLPRYGGGFV